MQHSDRNPHLQKALEILKNHFAVQKIYLFGSQAQNTARSDSDFDLVLVVRESTQDLFERRVTARTLLRDLPVSFDIFVYTVAEFENLKNDFGSIAETAVQTGREIDLL